MDDQILLARAGRNTPEPEVAEWVANVEGRMDLGVHAAGTDHGQARPGKRSAQFRERHVIGLLDHRAWIPLVNRLPEAGPQLRPSLARIDGLFIGSRHGSTLRICVSGKSASENRAMPA